MTADGHERRIATYMVEVRRHETPVCEDVRASAYVSQNFRTRIELEAFIHLTQLGQSEALMFGYRGWRRQWGDARKCGGALVWQLNDCWPTTSWAICDYYLRKKPSYYALARVLAPLAIGVQRGESREGVQDKSEILTAHSTSRLVCGACQTEQS